MAVKGRALRRGAGRRCQEETSPAAMSVLLLTDEQGALFAVERSLLRSRGTENHTHGHLHTDPEALGFIPTVEHPVIRKPRSPPQLPEL